MQEAIILKPFVFKRSIFVIAIGLLVFLVISSRFTSAGSVFATAHFHRESTTVCSSFGFDACLDLGESEDEQYHNLNNWGNISQGLWVPDSGDTNGRFQSLQEVSTAELWLSQIEGGYDLIVESEDGGCDDSFQIVMNGYGPMFTFTAEPDEYGAVTTSIPIFSELLSSNTVLINLQNRAKDSCGSAKTFNIQMRYNGNVKSYASNSFDNGTTSFSLHW